MQEQILEALCRGAAEEALAMARAAVDAEPGSAQAHRMLAAVLNTTGDHPAALAAIDRALGLSRDDPDLHVQRALILAGGRDADAARAALSRSIQLNPNQFDAYVLQAQLALGRGDLDEAERLARLAARIEPSHPWRLAAEGMVALGRRRHDDALALLTEAANRAPDDPQVLLGLALAHAAKGHDAFAEQALRKLVAKQGGPLAWRVLLAEALQRQQRPDEALEVLRPGLQAGATLAGLPRLAGELELAAGRPRESLDWLRRALAAEPRDARALAAAMTAWRQLDAGDEARATLDALLATSPGAVGLWQARLALDADDAAAARAVAARWSEALPDDPVALAARMQLSLQDGDADAAVAQARRLLERVPGHQGAHAVILDGLQASDPAAAIELATGWLASAPTDDARERLTARLALLEDAAGRPADAVARWGSLAALRAPSRLPLPPLSLPPHEVAAGAWPEWRTRGDDGEAIETLFLWGAPGSRVENVASLLASVDGFRADRMSPQAPVDVFQRFASVEALSNGDLDPAQAVAEWRAGLPARGIDGQKVVEWLVWWDNSLLRVLRTHVSRAGVLFVVRDPRDMLLQWAAFGSPMQIGFPSMRQAAVWMRHGLAQMAELVGAHLYRAAILRIDGMESDPAALAAALDEALGMSLPTTGVALARDQLPSGRWRQYADVLAEPFAVLAPIAKRLGYPDR